MQQIPSGTYGFRFQTSTHLHLPLCQLFAVGHDVIRSSKYAWDGLQRTDGPLLLFQYTISGRGRVSIQQQNFTVESETAFLVEIPSEHFYTFDEQDDHWEFLFILVRPHTILPLWNDIIELSGRIASLPLNSEPILRLTELYWAAREGKILDTYDASYFVYSFFMALKKVVDNNHSSAFIPTSITNAKQWIDENYANMIGQEQLAQQVGLSKYYFVRQFTKHIGISPNEYVNRKRIEKAIELLLSTNQSLEYIAQNVGYSSASYFIRVFRNLIGQTPANFRRKDNALQYNKFYFK